MSVAFISFVVVFVVLGSVTSVRRPPASTDTMAVGIGSVASLKNVTSVAEKTNESLPPMDDFPSLKGNQSESVELVLPGSVTLTCNDNSAVEFSDIKVLLGGFNGHTLSAVANDPEKTVVKKTDIHKKTVVLKVPYGGVATEKKLTDLVSEAVEEAVRLDFLNVVDLNVVQVDRVCRGNDQNDVPFKEDVLVITPYVDKKDWVECCPSRKEGTPASKRMLVAFLSFHFALYSYSQGYMDYDHSLWGPGNVFCKMNKEEKKEMWMYDFGQASRISESENKNKTALFEAITQAMEDCLPAGGEIAKRIPDLSTEGHVEEKFGIVKEVLSALISSV